MFLSVLLCNFAVPVPLYVPASTELFCTWTVPAPMLAVRVFHCFCSDCDLLD